MPKPLYESDLYQRHAGVAREARRMRNRSNGPWHYVGDPGEPAFTNGSNSGGSLQVLRFRWLLGGGIEIQGSVTGLTIGDVVFTLPPAYRPSGRQPADETVVGGPAVADAELRLAASADDGSFVAFRVLYNGNVIYGVA